MSSYRTRHQVWVRIQIFKLYLFIFKDLNHLISSFLGLLSRMTVQQWTSATDELKMQHCTRRQQFWAPGVFFLSSSSCSHQSHCISTASTHRHLTSKSKYSLKKSDNLGFFQFNWSLAQTSLPWVHNAFTFYSFSYNLRTLWITNQHLIVTEHPAVPASKMDLNFSNNQN